MKLRKLIADKRGVLGLETTKQVMLALLIMAVIGVSTILALTSLANSSIFTAGSAGQNSTNAITANLSGGIQSFFGSSGTIFSILVVVVIILAIAIIIAAVSRFGGAGGETSL